MRRLRRSLTVPALVAVSALLVAACGGSSSSSSSASKSGSTTSAVNIASSSKPCTYKFALITHGDNGNFWSVVYKGAKNAAADLGCTLTETYGSQQQGQAEPDDNAENAQIQNAINAHVDGMAISDHDPSLMNPTIKSAVSKGIPVVLLNAGCDDQDIAASGAITCVGQPEQLAGQASGAALQAAGRHQRALRHPPVRPEPARPLQRHRPGPGRRPAVQVRQPAVEGAGVHRADPVDAQRGVQPAAGDRPGHLVPAVPSADQCGDARSTTPSRPSWSTRIPPTSRSPRSTCPATSRTRSRRGRWRSRSTSSSTCRAICPSSSCTCSRSTRGRPSAAAPPWPAVRSWSTRPTSATCRRRSPRETTDAPGPTRQTAQLRRAGTGPPGVGDARVTGE